MQIDLDGDVCLVTGATRGAGAAITRALLDCGARVVGTGRSVESVTAAEAKFGDVDGRLHICVTDLASPTAPNELVNEVMTTFGGLDVIVNNAASFPFKTLLELDRMDWTELFDTKLVASAEIVRAALPYLKLSENAAVVNVSGSAAYLASTGTPHAGVVNAGINALTNMLAYQLAEFGIRVNGVAPGDTRTDRHVERLERLMEREGLSEEAAEARLASIIPLRRAIEPDEIAYAVVFLCSSQARSITGVTVPVDGGRHLAR